MARYNRKKITEQELTKKELEVLSKIPTENILARFKGLKQSFTKKQDREKYLKDEASKFLKKYFNETLDIPLTISPRLKANLGLFYSIQGKPSRIAITEVYFKYEQTDMVRLMSTLFHECTHYALCKKGLRYFDDDLVFDMILNRLSISSNYNNLNYRDVNSNYDLYVCPCGDKKCVFRGINKPTDLYWVKCEKCLKPISFVRQEIGVYSDIRKNFEEEVALLTVQV